MTTIRDFFERDFGTLSVGKALPTRNLATAASFELQGRVHYDYDANAKFVSYFIPRETHPMEIATLALQKHADILTGVEGVECSSRLPGERVTSSRELRFTGRVFLYMENGLSEPEIDGLESLGKQLGLAVRYRGPVYAAERTALEKPWAFISRTPCTGPVLPVG
jgi:hypothetical protein